MRSADPSKTVSVRPNMGIRLPFSRVTSRRDASTVRSVCTGISVMGALLGLCGVGALSVSQGRAPTHPVFHSVALAKQRPSLAACGCGLPVGHSTHRPFLPTSAGSRASNSASVAMARTQRLSRARRAVRAQVWGSVFDMPPLHVFLSARTRQDGAKDLRGGVPCSLN